MITERPVWVRKFSGQERDMPARPGWKAGVVPWHIWVDAQLVAAEGHTATVLYDNGQYDSISINYLVHPSSAAADAFPHDYDTESREQRRERLAAELGAPA